MEEQNEAGRHMRLELGVILTDKMIRNFSDHSANERTFLAWVRTSIAVMAFGFLVEKFDLFLEFGAPALAGRTLSLPGQKFGNIAGLAFIILGTAMVGIAAAHFVITAKNIYRPRRPAPGNRIANRHRICGAAGPSGLRSIPFDAHPCNEALTDFRKRFAVFFRDEITCILSAMQFKSV
jgi:putative membrane protein